MFVTAGSLGESHRSPHFSSRTLRREASIQGLLDGLARKAQSREYPQTVVTVPHDDLHRPVLLKVMLQTKDVRV